MAVQSVKELTVYRKSYALAMRVFEVSQRFPREEVFALTGQIRRSSRSVSQNLREAWAKRRYPAHFVSKLTDCDGENGETETSLDFARDCGYISVPEHRELIGLCIEVGKMLGSMIQKPDPFLLNPDSRSLPPASCLLTPDSSCSCPSQSQFHGSVGRWTRALSSAGSRRTASP
jgi:four helix bundle protein